MVIPNEDPTDIENKDKNIYKNERKQHGKDGETNVLHRYPRGTVKAVKERTRGSSKGNRCLKRRWTKQCTMENRKYILGEVAKWEQSNCELENNAWKKQYKNCTS